MALPQCIVGQRQVELEVWDPVGFLTQLGLLQEVQASLCLSSLHIGCPQVKGTGPENPGVLKLGRAVKDYCISLLFHLFNHNHIYDK